jgi:hypothetical protein
LQTGLSPQYDVGGISGFLQAPVIRFLGFASGWGNTIWQIHSNVQPARAVKALSHSERRAFFAVQLRRQGAP